MKCQFNKNYIKNNIKKKKTTLYIVFLLMLLNFALLVFLCGGTYAVTYGQCTSVGAVENKGSYTPPTIRINNHSVSFDLQNAYILDYTQTSATTTLRIKGVNPRYWLPSYKTIGEEWLNVVGAEFTYYQNAMNNLATLTITNSSASQNILIKIVSILY